MYLAQLQKFEGVWVGTERVTENEVHYEATARLVFQSVFDGRFFVCDYIQTVPERTASVAHGVFRNDDRTNKLTVTWFRSPAANDAQQADAAADGDALIFNETIDGRTTRTTYTAVRDTMTIRTECAVGPDDWKPLLEGTYRRR